MNKEQMVEHMRRVLDWHAKEYETYTDAEIKEEIKTEFKAMTRGYKALLNEMYKKPPFTGFRRDIERYIADRKEDNWE